MKQWYSWTPIGDTCQSIRCKYFSVSGCKHPNVKYCKHSSLYWPWQLDYDNMEILIEKRKEINNGKNN